MRKLMLMLAILASVAVLAIPSTGIAQSGDTPSWIETEDMFLGGPHDVIRGERFSGNRAVLMLARYNHSNDFTNPLYFARGDNLAVRIQGPRSGSDESYRPTEFIVLVNYKYVVSRTNFRPGLHWYTFDLQDNISGKKQVELVGQRRVGWHNVNRSDSLIIDKVKTPQGS